MRMGAMLDTVGSLVKPRPQRPAIQDQADAQPEQAKADQLRSRRALVERVEQEFITVNSNSTRPRVRT